MSSITLRRCTVERKTGKTMYERFFEEAQAMRDAVLSAHEIDITFFRDKPNTRGNVYYHTSDSTPFSANFIAEIGSEAQGTWMASYQKKTPPAYKLPYTDANSRSHRMVLALRCPTGAPAGVCSMFQDGAAVYDALRVSDEQQEVKKGEHFELTECVECTGDSVEDIIVIARLEPTYEIPYTNSSTSSALVLLAGELPRWVRPPESPKVSQISKWRPADCRAEGWRHISPSVLSDHRGPCFAHDKAVVTQRDYANVDGKLIAPAELYSMLVEGTLVLLTVYFATYIMKDQKNDRGEPQPDRKGMMSSESFYTAGKERTVSRFTRTDTRDRANQDARTIVDQTKIYQHLRRERRAADKLPKPSKAPSLKWRSVKDLMTVAKPAEPVIDLTVDDEAVPNSAANVPGPSITLECQAGLEALNAEADDLAAGTSADTTLAVFRDGVDIRLPFFRDLLAEKPIPGADTIRSLAEWSVDGSVEGQKSTTVAGKKIWDGAAQKIKF
ncbi:hypothetical protein B0H10DRAFT_2231148 [Mycena sp. CBHHK59/15]|nr:hypothetical protein B0H10DRAFT_2231148 [Mycena sp. CBHHK59/15]